MGDIYQVFYAYHTDKKEQTNNLKFTNLSDVLKYLTRENNYQDKKGEFYFVGIRKNEEVWNSLVTINELVSTVEKFISTGYKQNITTQDNTTMAAKTGFEYTVILHAIPVKDNSGNDVTPDSEILLNSQTVIAVDANHVIRIASRKIDTKVSDSDLGRVEIKVRNL